jgi:3-phenylpropionate/cinnamic acid dioxygenase small subunit
MGKLQERIAQIELKIPPLDTRITKLEDINFECSYPQSLKTLVSYNLKDLLDKCVQRLNTIENLEIKVDEASLRDKISMIELQGTKISKIELRINSNDV